uniref:Peptidase metallopeptidase domain-containing protein n=1 Tax=Magallana gigas TaxID=29159 RepID=A0A8W8MZ97_MAGGI
MHIVFLFLIKKCRNKQRAISPVNSLEKNALQRFNNHETSHRNVGSLSQCGNKAVYHGHRSRRSTKAFVWENDVVTWGFEKFSRKLERILQWKIFRKALRTWSRYSNLRFKYTRKRPDIRILFARYEHGDGDYNAFDGQGRTIGHAFRPKNGGTHFDDDELWSQVNEECFERSSSEVFRNVLEGSRGQSGH